MPDSPTCHSKTAGASALVTVDFVLHCTKPCLFLPLKRAPTAGPSAPSSQVHETHSGLHRPICVTSVRSAHTFSGGAAMSIETWSTAGDSRRCHRVACVLD